MVKQPAAPPAAGLPVMPLFVSDLDAAVTEAQLYDLFIKAGPISAIRICRRLSTQAGFVVYAFISYASPADAARAAKEFDSVKVNGRPIRVMLQVLDSSVEEIGRFLPKKSTDDHKMKPDVVSVENLSDSTTDDTEGAGCVVPELNGIEVDRKDLSFGVADHKVKLRVISVKNLSESTREDTVDAGQEVHELKGIEVDRKELSFEVADQKNPKGETEPGNSEQDREDDAFDKTPGLNLYVKHLDEAVDDEKLREMFSEFGQITSAKVMLHERGVSRGFGFVAFSTLEAASRALQAMNKKVVSGKPLYVAVAQRKEDRKAMLQAKFSQVCPSPAPAMAPPQLPLYCSPPQVFYAQAPQMVAPHPQARFGIPQHLLPQMVPGSSFSYGPPPMLGMYTPYYQTNARASAGARASKILHPVPPRSAVAAPDPANASSGQEKRVFGGNLNEVVEQLQKVPGMVKEIDEVLVLDCC